MRNLLRPPLRIALARDRITVLQPGGVLVRKHAVLVDEAIALASADIDAVLPQQLAAALALLAMLPKRAHIVLADDLVRYFMVTPVPHSARLSDCQAAAQMRFEHLYAEPAAAWTIDADWDALSPFLACAVSKRLIANLHTSLDGAGLQPVSILPHFIATWNGKHAQRHGNAWLVSTHRSQLTIGVTAHGKPVAVRAIIAADGAVRDRAWLSQQIDSEALRLGVAPPHAVDVFGDIPNDWLRADATDMVVRFPEAAQGLARTPGIALALAGVR